jgi:very-short-patch-repair endonuclease
MTEAEAVLWTALRRRQVAGLRFRKQHPVGPYILDFYCSEQSLAVEVDGGVHEDPNVHMRDVVRTLNLNHECITVLRFSNNDVLHHLDTVLDRIAATCIR